MEQALTYNFQSNPIRDPVLLLAEQTLAARGLRGFSIILISYKYNFLFSSLVYKIVVLKVKISHFPRALPR